MRSSESEDFESADEGTENIEKKERKKRHSSSNYSDNALENDPAPLKAPAAVATKITKEEKQQKGTDGWDDFEIDEEESHPKPVTKTDSSNMAITEKLASTNIDNVKINSKDTGWDDFDDWGDSTDNKEQLQKPQPNDKTVKEDKLDATLMSKPTSSGWGWGGWGVDSLLSSATVGISTISNQVSQGLSTVLETSIGIPEPEELAKQTAKDKDSKPSKEDNPESVKEMTNEENIKEPKGSGDGAFDFGSILKFVGNTGSRVITGGLDTLETIGRKTMEVLQDGDPGLERKKRAMMGFFDPDKPILSQVLREAKSKADEEDRIKEEKREAKEVHYENLFDDFEGLVHLEALEMLSKQVSMRIEERVQSASPKHRQDIKETLQQVAELCEMPDEEDEEETMDSDQPKPEAFLERLQRATKDLGVKLQFQPLVKQYTEILEYMDDDSNDFTDKTMYKKAIGSLAQATALSVEIYHKAAEMLLVKPRRSTADEADGLTQLTVVLTQHTSDVATVFTQEMDKRATYENAIECKNYITNIFLEAGNSATYIQNAFQLTQPIVQIGYLPKY